MASGNRRRLALGLGAVVVVLVAAWAAIAASGIGRASHRPAAHTASRHPTSTASSSTTTTVPAGDVLAGEWTLPAPTTFEGVVGLGFPPSPMGAVALGFSALSAAVNIDPDVAASVIRDAAANPSPSQVAAVAQGIEQGRAQYGLPPTGPTSATMALSLDACGIESQQPGRVVAKFEGTLVVEGPGIQGTTANWSKAVAIEWTGSDWRLDPNAQESQPAVAFPGTPDSVAEGWHPCTEG